MRANSISSGAHPAVAGRPTYPTYDIPAVSMTLTAAEEKLREECERTIAEGFVAMEKVVRAAETLRDKQLYRSTHGTWEAYCRDTFKKGARRIQQLVAGQAVIDEMKALPGPVVLPTNEKQTRPLQPLSKEDRREVWETSVKESGGKEPSAGKVKEVADRRKPKTAEPLNNRTLNLEQEAESTEVKNGVRLAVMAGHRGEVNVSWLERHFGWERELACQVFDALVDQGLVEGRKMVPRVEEKFLRALREGRNPEGTESSEAGPIESLAFRHELLMATVRAQERREDEWVSAYDFQHLCGTRRFYGYPLGPGLVHQNKGSALLEALKNLRADQESMLSGRDESAKQKRVTKLLIEWCNTQIKALGDKGGISNHRGAKSTEGELPFDVSRSRIAGKLDPELVSELNAGMDRTVSGLAREIGLKLKSCDQAIDDLPLPLAQRFGQARHFMECAWRELERLQAESETQGREERQGAKAQQEEAEKAEGYVICRMPNEPRGYNSKGRPRFGPGWGHDPRSPKVTVFSSKREALEDAKGWEKVISLKEAIKLADKAKKS